MDYFNSFFIPSPSACWAITVFATNDMATTAPTIALVMLVCIFSILNVYG